MDKRTGKVDVKKETGSGKVRVRDGNVSYRLKCVKTANGLSHFSMYGDVPKEKTIL